MYAPFWSDVRVFSVSNDGMTMKKGCPGDLSALGPLLIARLLPWAYRAVPRQLSSLCEGFGLWAACQVVATGACGVRWVPQ